LDCFLLGVQIEDLTPGYVAATYSADLRLYPANPHSPCSTHPMSLFNRTPKPAAYVAPTGAITLDRSHFLVVMRTRPSYAAYARSVGLAAARAALDNCFIECLRGISANTFWTYGSTANYGNPVALRFADDAALNFFMQVVDGLFEFDLGRIDKRGTYANGLKGKAAAGLLFTDLQGNTEPEDNYYSAPVGAVVRPGAPAIPANSAALVNQSKGLAWLTHGVQGNASAFKRLLLQSTKTDGTFPLGADSTFLFQAWRTLVPLAPAYRGWNSAAGMQKYPSNIGGTKVLDDVLADLFNEPMPAAGSNDWYGLALYLMGSIITVQAFTDGNKRMSRFAYTLMLLSGGVPMVVPNNLLGATLGDM
jgi:hypothetical protein